MSTPILRKLSRAALFSLVRGASWALGSALVAAVVWWARTR
ncbi:hypothetical protein ACFWNK_34780 [Streptomyces sp. NPDC058417]